MYVYIYIYILNIHIPYSSITINKNMMHSNCQSKLLYKINTFIFKEFLNGF
jgi:hypothetical protein